MNTSMFIIQVQYEKIRKEYKKKNKPIVEMTKK